MKSKQTVRPRCSKNQRTRFHVPAPLVLPCPLRTHVPDLVATLPTNSSPPRCFHRAQIENCNRSASCCDAYDGTTGSCTTIGGEEGEVSPYYCAALATPGQVMHVCNGMPCKKNNALPSARESRPRFQAVYFDVTQKTVQ